MSSLCYLIKGARFRRVTRRMRHVLVVLPGHRDTLALYVPESAPWNADQYHASGSAKIDKTAKQITDQRLEQEIAKVRGERSFVSRQLTLICGW